jgi:hypothetical protein
MGLTQPRFIYPVRNLFGDLQRSVSNTISGL